MTPDELEELRGQTVTTVERAAQALGIGRTLGYQLAREEGRLCEGVRVLRVGRTLKVPCRDILAALGYSEEPRKCACRENGGQ
jgi:hypothetical protein